MYSSFVATEVQAVVVANVVRDSWVQLGIGAHDDGARKLLRAASSNCRVVSGEYGTLANVVMSRGSQTEPELVASAELPLATDAGAIM